MFWLQNFDTALQYYRLDSSIYGPPAATFTLSCHRAVIQVVKINCWPETFSNITNENCKIKCSSNFR